MIYIIYNFCIHIFKFGSELYSFEDQGFVHSLRYTCRSTGIDRGRRTRVQVQKGPRLETQCFDVTFCLPYSTWKRDGLWCLFYLTTSLMPNYRFPVMSRCVFLPEPLLRNDKRTKLLIPAECGEIHWDTGPCTHSLDLSRCQRV